MKSLSIRIGPTGSGIKALRDRQGALVETLTSLADFRLFLLVPQSGRYVVGFGKAYELKQLHFFG